MASNVHFTLPKQAQLPSDQTQYLRFLLQPKYRPKQKNYTDTSQVLVPRFGIKNKQTKRKSIINKPIKRTQTLMSNYTNHQIQEDKKLHIKAKIIKSSSAMAFSKDIPRKRKSFYGQYNNQLKKTRKLTLGSFSGFRSKSKEKLQNKQQEFIFSKSKPKFMKVIQKKKNKQKPLQTPYQLASISSESNNSQIIEFKRQRPKSKQKGILINRSNSNEYRVNKIQIQKRPNSSYKVNINRKRKKKIINTQFYDPFNQLKNKINKQFQEARNQKYPFYPPIKYPDLKINPFRIPNIPQPPSSNLTVSQYIDLARELCRKFKFQIHQNEDLLIKRFKNCIIFEIHQHKKTVIWHYSGKLYIGGWQFSQIGDGKKVGQGFQYYPNIDCYKGYFLDNKRHGLGTLLQQNGNIYQGYWKNGLRNGKGVYYEQSKNRYSYTNWKNNKRHGFGTFQFSKRNFYKGDIKNSVPQGNGLWVFQNGDVYRGQLKSGRFDGTGRYQWSTGAYYYGSFSKGMREGIGLWKSKKSGGDIYYGQYKNNKKQGYGIYEQKRGQIYRGYFLADQRQGKGILQFQNRSQIYGLWIKNALSKIQHRIIQVTHQSDQQSENGMHKLLKQHIQPQYTKIKYQNL